MTLDEATDEPTQRPVERVAAFRRPGLALLVYAYRAGGAIVLALPLSLALSTIVAGYPRGDAELFDPGGVMLLEAARILGPSASPLGFQAAAVALVLAFVGLVPLAMLMDGLGLEGKLKLGVLLSRASERLGTLSLLLGVAVLAETLGTTIFLFIGEKSFDRVAWSAAAHKDVSEIVLWVTALALALAVGVTHDLARAYAIRKRFGFYDACACALRAMQRTGLRAYFAYVWRGAIGVAAIGAALFVGSQVDLTRTSGLLLTALADQGALLVAAAMRASWLAAAIRLADHVYEDEATEWSHRVALAEPLVESTADVEEPAGNVGEGP